MRQWCYQGPARSAPRSGHALSEILPAFQLKTNINVAPTVGASAPDARRAAVAAVLAFSIQPFQFAELFRASCGGLNFETTIEAVRAEAHMRIHRRAKVAFNSRSVGREGANHKLPHDAHGDEHRFPTVGATGAKAQVQRGAQRMGNAEHAYSLPATSRNSATC